MRTASDMSGHGDPRPRCSQDSRWRSVSASLLQVNSDSPCSRKESRMARSASAPEGAGSMRSASVMAPRRTVSRTRTARRSRSKLVCRRVSIRSASVGADVVLAYCRGGRSCARSAPCPAGRRRPERPRPPAGRRHRAWRRSDWPGRSGRVRRAALATRSGQAWISKGPAGDSFAVFLPAHLPRQLPASCRAAAARGESQSNPARAQSDADHRCRRQGRCLGLGILDQRCLHSAIGRAVRVLGPSAGRSQEICDDAAATGMARRWHGARAACTSPR